MYIDLFRTTSLGGVTAGSPHKRRLPQVPGMGPDRGYSSHQLPPARSQVDYFIVNTVVQVVPTEVIMSFHIFFLF